MRKTYRGNKPKKPFLSDKEWEALILICLYGLIGWGLVTLAGQLAKGNKEAWQAFAVGIATSVGLAIQNNIDKRKKPNNNNNLDLDTDPSPVKPKPFNPPPFESVQEKVEVQEGNYVSMARDLGKRHLELTVSTNIVSPTYIPIQVSSLVNGNRDLALRLFDGEANRNKGKSEQWVWEKVAEDLIRDRR